eukprot:4795010-Prymnesium_polylepis.1
MPPHRLSSLCGRDVHGVEEAERSLVALEADAGDAAGDRLAALVGEPRRQLVLVLEGGQRCADSRLLCGETLGALRHLLLDSGRDARRD